MKYLNNINNIYKTDKQRQGTLPLYQYWYRRTHKSSNVFNKAIYRVLQFLYHVEIPYKVTIGKGLYIGHPYGITINPRAVIGDNCNIHKGVTIGQENRGKRKGVPVIGNLVWIGVNATVVGGCKIGNDVLIAPNAFVNVDVPNHSIVFGNPCIIKHKDNATEGYINNVV